MGLCGFIVFPIGSLTFLCFKAIVLAASARGATAVYNDAVRDGGAYSTRTAPRACRQLSAIWATDKITHGCLDACARVRPVNARGDLTRSILAVRLLVFPLYGIAL